MKLFCEKMLHCEILLEIKVGKKCPHKAHKHCFNRSDFPPFDLFHKIVIDLCVSSATTTVLHLSRNGNSFRRIFHLYLSSRTFFPFVDFVDDIALENCQAENIALVRLVVLRS